VQPLKRHHEKRVPGILFADPLAVRQVNPLIDAATAVRTSLELESEVLHVE
jgi:hypothetical protein